MVSRPRNARGIYSKSRSRLTKPREKSKALPEFLEQAEVAARLRQAPYPKASFADAVSVADRPSCFRRDQYYSR